MSRPTKAGIYEISCSTNQSKYIGSSGNLTKRIKDHWCALAGNYHKNSHLQYAYNLYGKDSFSIKILFYCDPQNLTFYETLLINKTAPRFNMIVAEVGRFVHSDETKKKISDAKKGKPGHKMSLETRKKQSEIATGRPKSEEAKRHISEAKKGKQNINLSHPHTEETKRKIGIASKNRAISDETRKKLSNSITLYWKRVHGELCQGQRN